MRNRRRRSASRAASISPASAPRVFRCAARPDASAGKQDVVQVGAGRKGQRLRHVVGQAVHHGQPGAGRHGRVGMPQGGQAGSPVGPAGFARDGAGADRGLRPDRQHRVQRQDAGRDQGGIAAHRLADGQPAPGGAVAGQPVKRLSQHRLEPRCIGPAAAFVDHEQRPPPARTGRAHELGRGRARGAGRGRPRQRPARCRRPARRSRGRARGLAAESRRRGRRGARAPAAGRGCRSCGGRNGPDCGHV